MYTSKSSGCFLNTTLENLFQKFDLFMYTREKKKKVFEPCTTRSNSRTLLTILFGFSVNSSWIKERENEAAVPPTETNRLLGTPLYFLIRFKTSFLRHSSVHEWKELNMHENIQQKTKTINSIEKITYLQPTRGRGIVLQILTSTEIFNKNIN